MDLRAAALATAGCAAIFAVGAAADDSSSGGAVPDDGGAAFTAEVAKAFAPFVDGLKALGRWCDASALLLERSRVAEALVLLDPDDETGRAWLRFKRQKDGSWKPTSTKPFFDERTELLPEWNKRRAEVAEPMRAALAPFLDRGDDWRTVGTRDRVLRALVDMNPDDASLRGRNGETLVAGRWMLAESAATAAGRKRIVDAAGKARLSTASLKPVFSFEPSWSTVLVLGEMPVHANLPKPETVEVAARILQARTFLGLALDVTPRKPRKPQAWILDSYDSNPGFLATRSDVSEQERKHLSTWAAYWLGEELVVAEYEQSWRVDVAVRKVLDRTYSEAGYLGSAPAWISEGVGMYLTYALVGTRLTTFTKESTYSDQTVWREVPDPRADWVALARRMIEKGFDPQVGALTSLQISSMTKDDGLMAYALAAYFLEGRPAALKQILVRMTAKASFHQALAEVCSLDADGLQTRFVRWLRETTK